VIAHLKGRVEQVSPGCLVLDVAGVGFFLKVPESLSGQVRLGEERTVPTQLVMREDDLSLYGFSSPTERELFLLLTSISGVGPKMALRILGGVRPHELAEAILEEDLRALTALPGVGTKTAKRIMVELSEKIANLAPQVGSGLEREAISVLCSLGCTADEAQAAVAEALAGAGPDASVERLVMEAMRVLGQGEA
jgi:Holliday junction DNA helicase RuvA